MHRRPPVALPWTVASLPRAAWLLTLVLLLAACGAPATPPSLQLALGSSSVAIIRGTSADVQVDLTRLGGAADDVGLSLTGLPANVTGSFAPATLSGGVLTSTLTLTVGAGASEGTTALNVAASGGSLSDDAALSLEVTSLTVTGHVEAALARPLIGATVASQGETAFTDGTGAFTLTGLSVPYDVSVSSAGGGGGLHVFEGMTSPTPLLRPTFASLDPPVMGFATTISGTLIDGAVGVDEAAIVCIEGLAVAVYGCDILLESETGFSIAAEWFDGAIAATRLHALHFEIDADSLPVAYLGYETIELNLSDGVAALADLDFDPVDAATLSGTTAHPASLPDTALIVHARFGPNLSMPLIQSMDPADDFALLVPDLPGIGYDLLFLADGPDDVVYTWKRDVGLVAGDLAVNAPAQPVAPADGELGVDLTTSFETTSTGGARTYLWVPDVDGPLVALTTTRTAVTIPDPAIGGFAFPAGLGYAWAILGHGDGDVDEAAAGGLADIFPIQYTISGQGGPGFDADRTFSSPANSRDFTFEP